MTTGEGAAFLGLEDLQHAQARGATIRAELIGYGLSNDCGHITRPSVAGQADAMRAALDDAALEPAEVGYVNAHGTATAQNDSVETAALKAVFGQRATAGRLPVSSTKALHGHLLGAAGALEFVIPLLALERGTVPPTMHVDMPDPACDLDYVVEGPRSVPELRAVLTNSFAFGGTNAVLIGRRFKGAAL